MTRIADFTAQYSRPNTRKMYRTGVRAYLSFIYGRDRDPKISLDVFEDLADRYLLEGRDYPKDVIAFAASFGSSPPKTARVYLAAVKEFLLFSEIELRELDLRKIKKRMPKGGAATVEKILDAETLRVLLHHCNLMMQALVLLLASSGMRIGEALVLDMKDITLPDAEGIGQIAVRGLIRTGGGAKGGVQRYTYCSAEATAAIREWLKVRDGYLQESRYRGRGIGQVKSMDDSRLFPVSPSTVSGMWLNALTAAGLVSRDSVTNRLQIHIHMTRKYFSSQMRLAVPVDVVEGLMGHSGYLADAYRRYTRQQVEDLYRKGEPYVTIQMTDEIRELRTNTDKKLQAQSSMMENLVLRNMSLENRVGELENLVKNIEWTSKEREQE